MMQHSNSNPIEMDLIALADGELDAAGMQRVQTYLKELEKADHSDAATSAESHNAAHMDIAYIRALLLKQHIHAAVLSQTPPVSPNLQNNIAQLLGTNTSVSTTTTATPTAAPNLKLAGSSAQAQPKLVSPWLLASRWAPAGIAAMLLVGALLTQLWQPLQPASSTNQNNRVATSNSSTDTTPVTNSKNSNAISNSVFNQVASLTGNQHVNSAANPQVLTTSPQAPVAYAQLSSDRISAFGNRHSMCSKKLERLYKSSEFPKEVAQMPQAIAGCIGKKPKGSLDLSHSGYQFTQAGECGVPGQPSVHLVYRTKTSDDSVSLWVVSYNGRPQLAEGTLYQGDPADSEHPIFFFRQDDLVYYLVGNAFDHTRSAAQTLVVASR